MTTRDRLIKLKQQMEQEIQQLKAQLEQDEQQRIQLQARRTQAEQRRADLRAKHKEEVWFLFLFYLCIKIVAVDSNPPQLQRLQRDLFESFKTEDKLQTDLMQQNYVKTSLQTETNISHVVRRVISIFFYCVLQIKY